MDKKDIIQKLKNGEMKLYEVDKYSSSTEQAIDIRREFIEETTNTKLNTISNYTLDMESASKKNIENPIGTIQIPIGVAGPLRINGEYTENKDFYVPLATSEGALVASVNRGCSTITEAGGVNARVIDDKMTRAPVIKAKSGVQAIEIKKWFEDNFQKLKKIAESTTNHGKLLKIDPILVVGNYIYPRFVYSTGDSMGMNMVTIATEKVLELLLNETDAQLIALSGNACVDKKPSSINLVEGRGKTVIADIIIPEEIVKNKLKTTAEAIVEVNTAKNLIGSAISGSMGFNAHFANMIGAIFLATGQDIAHVVEGSLGITTAEDRDGDLYFSVTMPDLPIATIGGGTSLKTANESLEILGVAGSGNVKKFAEIVIATVLAGELSLMGALAAGHLARAHKELGRA
ncbi:3-hydroxy-3-methylglutaryl-CoA reductase [Methanobrevibacter arboriphilus]|jgi:hydroxymethylglutaryl-CoA reductase (NADPH)|uniref:3-hydroxy-3-methylglutaryl-CoA reductase n=1 Tax=Methanobrevibacter arboriphilus TaxID=39441 RepID=A0ACA8R1E4_METAZ|nr:hydroxymethylglutaryl-CoA reductase (NADPH) [Methanobrevibacter arboriphilus]BBL61068.1 3-hydroxy-3-methylglutaryl-CoA reductase [Methanobrevibacter arboriphilus]GLI12606.1 3-hydroxy-3-methylglutaryl-CoA reductase [Methanobrevibacter arboriphilus]